MHVIIKYTTDNTQSIEGYYLSRSNALYNKMKLYEREEGDIPKNYIYIE